MMSEFWASPTQLSFFTLFHVYVDGRWGQSPKSSTCSPKQTCQRLSQVSGCSLELPSLRLESGQLDEVPSGPRPLETAQHLTQG